MRVKPALIPTNRRGWLRCAIMLLVLALMLVAPQPAGGQAATYSEDFEDGQADGWEYAQGWELVLDGENHVLRGAGHVNAYFRGAQDVAADVQTFQFRYQLPGGSAHIQYRLNGKGSRYFVRMEQNALILMKSILISTAANENQYEHPALLRKEIAAGGNAWHTLRIRGEANHIRVYLDEVLALDYTDEDHPYLSGGVGFETLDDTQPYLMVDDIWLESAPAAEESGLQWVFTGGPRGGIGYDIRIDPQNAATIWVTDAYAGAHQSLDGGLTWTAKNENLNARVGFSGDAIPVFSLTIDPSDPRILWAGTQGLRGVYKSVDGGETWAEMDEGIQAQPNMEIRGFTVDPNDSNVVYCGGNYLVDAQNNIQRGFIYKTTDGGEHWALLAEPTALVRWILIDPSNTQTVYASTGIFDRFSVQPAGVLKSSDGGQTWAPVNAGLTSLAVGALTMHPNDPRTLLAGTGKASYFVEQPEELYGGVFKTTDGGEHWRQVLPANGEKQEARFSAIAYAPSDPNIVYADSGNQFFRSQDGGETWQAFDVSPESGATFGESRGQPIALVVHPQDPNRLYMNAYDGGVFLSQDGGQTWRDASKGYSGAQAWFVSVHPADAALVIVASKNGIHLSSDGGATWQGRITAGWINNMTSAAFDPLSKTTLLAGTEINGTIWRSADGGASWARALGPLGEDLPNGRRAIYQIAFAPSDPKIAYAATGVDTMTVSIAPGANGPGAFKSVDGGVTWQAVNAGLEEALYNTLAVAVHPGNADVAYLGTLTGGVFKTVDGGQEWAASSQGLSAREIRAIAIDPLQPRVVYAGAGGGGVWRSDDEGATWRQISAGLPPEANIFGLAVDPVHPGVVYAADRLSGVYLTRDGGETWNRINAGLRLRAVNELAISGDGQHVYAATEGNGVYRLDLNGAAPQAQNPPTATATDVATPAAPSSPATAQPTAGEASATVTPATPATQTAFPVGWLIGGGVVLAGMLGLLIGQRKKK